jgi:type VI secretion system protein ImpE
VLEAVIEGRYFWVPFHSIQRIGIEEPGDLRDMVWLPAQFTWSNGGNAVGLIPTRYAGSERSDDGSVALARATSWQELGEDLIVGLGQRVLATDAGEFSLVDVREIKLNTAEPNETPADATTSASSTAQAS